LGSGKKKENLDKKLTEMEERMTDKFQVLLQKNFEKQQAKQVVTIKEEKKGDDNKNIE
jgi:hypothetical protein